MKKVQKNKNIKTEPSVKGVVHFPANVLGPVAAFLSAQVQRLEGNKKKLTEEDPFSDESRITNNAAPDTEAEEQYGHARTSALKEQVDRKIIQMKKALARVRMGKYGICESCGKMIDTDRLMVYPEATLCVSCEAKKEK
jgi:DnaK suppressor protein